MKPGAIAVSDEACGPSQEHQGTGSARLRVGAGPLLEAALTRENLQAAWKRVIPKSDGSQRELGIPAVVDRLIGQALLQVLQPLIDPTFSEHSHGFRPGRRAHDAVKAARVYVQSGKRVVVDVDLAKFFDRCNHDILVDRLKRAWTRRSYGSSVRI